MSKLTASDREAAYAALDKDGTAQKAVWDFIAHVVDGGNPRNPPQSVVRMLQKRQRIKQRFQRRKRRTARRAARQQN